MSEILLQVSNLLNLSESATLLGVSRPTIYLLIKRGRLHPLIIADRPYLVKEEVDRLAAERKGE